MTERGREMLVVSLETGKTRPHGALALVVVGPEPVVGLVGLRGTNAWGNDYIRGMTILGDEIFFAGGHRIAVYDVATLEPRRILAHARFADLHQLATYRGQLLAVNTWQDEVLVVDPETGVPERFCCLPIPGKPPLLAIRPEHHHLNTIHADSEDWILTAHGFDVRGAIWRQEPGEAPRVVWPPADRPPLQAPHDGHARDGAMVYCESGRGVVASSSGREVYVGGWTRGFTELSDGRWAVGVNRFRDRPSMVPGPCIAFIRDWRLEGILALGAPPEDQTYAILRLPQDQALRWRWVRDVVPCT